MGDRVKTEFFLFAQFASPLITFDQVVEIVGVKPRTVRNWISDGKFPRPIPGDRFRIQDVAAWIDAQAASSAA